MKTTIYFIRHGKTDWNTARRVQGTIDNPLNAIGKKEIITLAQKIKAYPWDVFITSPLVRAVDTAKIIKQEGHLNVPIIINNDFIERNFGEAEGKNITKELNHLIYTEQILGIEKAKDLQERILQATIKVANEYPNKTILIISHSHVIKSLLVSLSDTYSYKTPINNLSLTSFTYEKNVLQIIDINKSL